LKYSLEARGVRGSESRSTGIEKSRMEGRQLCPQKAHRKCRKAVGSGSWFVTGYEFGGVGITFMGTRKNFLR
jgi:hypothetical protein